MRKRAAFSVLIIGCLIAVNAEAIRKPVTGNMKVTVIHVDQRGYFNYHGMVSKIIQRGEEVVWVCNAPFAVYFGKESPVVINSKGIPLPWGSTVRGIQSQSLDGFLKKPPSDLDEEKMARLKALREKLGQGAFYIARAWVSRNALTGTYKYIIAAYAHGRVWVDDPEDIIDPPPKRR